MANKPDILPIIHYALDSPTHSLVDASLRTLPMVLPILDFSTIKNELFPVIAAVFAKTSSMGIKIRGLEAFKTLCGGSSDAQSGLDGDGLTGLEPQKPRSSNVAILDKYTIQEKVVPLLRAIKTKEPAVMVGLESYDDFSLLTINVRWPPLTSSAKSANKPTRSSSPLTSSPSYGNSVSAPSSTSNSSNPSCN